MSVNDTAPPHGTRRRYEWTMAPCRCGACRDANAVYIRAWRQCGTQFRLPV